MSAHLAPELALALSALPPGDPERQAAELHVRSCARCAALLQEGAQMLALLDAADAPETFTPALKERVERAVFAPVTARGARFLRMLLIALGLVSIALALVEGQGGTLLLDVGVRCAAFELGVALVPFALAGTLGVRGVVALEPLRMASVAMAGALVGQLLLGIECPAQASEPHLLIFHVGGVLLAALLGYVATGWFVTHRRPGVKP